MCIGGRSIALITDTHIFEKSTFNRAYSMSDYYLRLSSNDKILWSGIMEGRSIKTLEVLKQRGIELRGGEKVEFEIKPKIGIQILPFCKVRI
jgi:archaellum biogenesis ATPase FlaH